ncbi:hypothetical protein, partial [Salmonella sp. s58408]|uniref:hypothetical protein n=1 Tax=Salmonella sp. s58408 TaxID=3159701 RepID=UPI0039813E2F
PASQLSTNSSHAPGKRPNPTPRTTPDTSHGLQNPRKNASSFIIIRQKTEIRRKFAFSRVLQDEATRQQKQQQGSTGGTAAAARSQYPLLLVNGLFK